MEAMCTKYIGLHTTDPYSSLDLTNVINNKRNVWKDLKSFILRIIKPRLLNGAATVATIIIKGQFGVKGNTKVDY